MYDQWRRARSTPRLAGLVDVKRPVRGYEEHAQQHAEQGQSARKEVGRGRVFYLPGLQFDGPLPESGPYFKVDNRYWKNPANAREFLDGVYWARNGDASVTVEGPRYLIANAAEQPSKRSTAIHLANYNAHQPATDIHITFCNPNGSRPSSAHLYSPDLSKKLSLDATPGGQTTTFRVREVKTYVIAYLEWA